MWLHTIGFLWWVFCKLNSVDSCLLWSSSSIIQATKSPWSRLDVKCGIKNPFEINKDQRDIYYAISHKRPKNLHSWYLEVSGTHSLQILRKCCNCWDKDSRWLISSWGCSPLLKLLRESWPKFAVRSGEWQKWTSESWQRFKMGSQHRDPGEKWAEIQISEETVADGQYMLNQGTTKTVLGDGRLAPVGYTHWWSQSFPLWGR